VEQLQVEQPAAVGFEPEVKVSQAQGVAFVEVQLGAQGAFLGHGIAGEDHQGHAGHGPVRARDDAHQRIGRHHHRRQHAGQGVGRHGQQPGQQQPQ
jgi:hypothetical protein